MIFKGSFGFECWMGSGLMEFHDGFIQCDQMFVSGFY